VASQQPAAGLTWTSSNTAVITLSTDDPPIITAVAAGTAPITGGSASADVTVYQGPTLPTGTQVWSNQGMVPVSLRLCPQFLVPPAWQRIRDAKVRERTGDKE
jgi:hypothetical protein